MSQKELEMGEMRQYFGVLYPFVVNDEITDIDFNGSTLWITNCDNQRTLCRDCRITKSFVSEFTQRVSNTVSKPFNKQNPILEAETKTLRITIVHESAAVSGRTICIRKSLPYVRMTEASMLENAYCSRDVLNILKTCVYQKKNMVFCGEPGVGKTECAKFFSQFISPQERVITIEDNPEWHYHEMFPERDCVELRINAQMDYTKAIKTCLRLNPKWMMLSEARSKEVIYLLEGFSTGVRGFTTLHTDDVRKVPDRMINMAAEALGKDRMENDIYAFIDVAVLIRKKEMQIKTGVYKIVRYIDQVAFFSREEQKNICRLVVNAGELVDENIPLEEKTEENFFEGEQKYSDALRQDFSMVAEEGGTYGGNKTVFR